MTMRRIMLKQYDQEYDLEQEVRSPSKPRMDKAAPRIWTTIFNEAPWPPVPRPHDMAAAKPSSSPFQSLNFSAPYIPPPVSRAVPAMMMRRDCRANNNLTQHLMMSVFTVFFYVSTCTFYFSSNPTHCLHNVLIRKDLLEVDVKSNCLIMLEISSTKPPRMTIIVTMSGNSWILITIFYCFM